MKILYYYQPTRMRGTPMQQRKGFTLIELLVVISIIAILAVIVFTQVQGLTGRARNTTTQSLVREAGNSINLYRNDEGAGDAVVQTSTAWTPAAANGVLQLTATTGDTPWGPFNGTLSSTAFTYPTRIVRVPSAAHILTYRVLSADTTVLASAGAAANYTLPAAGCVQVIGALVNASGTTTASFYRNGVVSTTSLTAPAGGNSTAALGATNLSCTN
jgi:prepilin-type N-terminal cleavage/methylation domain-containing protein